VASQARRPITGENAGMANGSSMANGYRVIRFAPAGRIPAEGGWRPGSHRMPRAPASRGSRVAAGTGCAAEPSCVGGDVPGRPTPTARCTWHRIA